MDTRFDALAKALTHWTAHPATRGRAPRASEREARFDDLARSMARPLSRRQLLRLLTGALGATLFGAPRPAATRDCPAGSYDCHGGCCPDTNPVCCDPMPSTYHCCPAGTKCALPWGPSGSRCCPGQVCEDGRCCPTGRCCGKTCCGADQVCCDGACHDSCPAGKVCCDKLCYPDGSHCCGERTCEVFEQCCGGKECWPMASTCCGTTVCGDGQVCCGGKCYPAGKPTCGVCPCDAGMVCCSGSCHAGEACCGGGPPCGPGKICCGSGCLTGVLCCGTGACAPGQVCCSGVCRAGVLCCGTGACAPGQVCCGGVCLNGVLCCGLNKMSEPQACEMTAAGPPICCVMQCCAPGYACCGSRCCTKTEADKDKAKLWFAVLGVVAGIGSPVCLKLKNPCIIITSVSGAVAATGALVIMAMDPSDPNFTVVPRPARPTLPPIEAGTALDAWSNNMAQMIALAVAMGTARNRATGAAEAGDAGWERRQLHVARQYALELAEVLTAQPGLMDRLAREVQAAGCEIPVDAGSVRCMQAEVRRAGLAHLLPVVIPPGVDPSIVAEEENMLLALDPDEVVEMSHGRFTGLLTNPAGHAALRAFADRLVTDARAQPQRRGGAPFRPPRR